MTILDFAPASAAIPPLPRPAGANGWPDDTPSGTGRTALIDRDLPEPERDARNFAVATGFDWQLPHWFIQELEQVVAELVENADEHAAWPTGRHIIVLTLTLMGRRIVIEVRDPDPTLPTWPASVVWDNAMIDSADENHSSLDGLRGLVLVRSYCDGDLSASRVPDGKAVRAVLNIPGGAR